MKAIYKQFANGIVLTEILRNDVESFLNYHNEQGTFIHTIKVALEASRIAISFNADPELAEQAALLHDVSNVIPKVKMMDIAEELSIEILEDELRFPWIIHQKLSKHMSIHLFGCTNIGVLNAIECHTTLKAGASLLDKILFVADKISWDLPGEHWIYLNHVWEQRDKLKLIHPWLIEAREELVLALHNVADMS